MQIEFEIDGMRLTRTSDAYVTEGSKNFVQLLFTFSDDWDGIDKYALFARDNKTYEVAIVDGKCIVPYECARTQGQFQLTVVGKANEGEVIATTSDKAVRVSSNEFEENPTGSETRLTNTFLVDTLAKVKEYADKVANVGIEVDKAVESARNAATSEQNAKGYADKAKEYSESVNVYIPSVSQDGVMTWTNKAGLANPAPVNVKGERGEKGEQGVKGDTGARGERGEQGPKGDKGEQGTGITIKGRYDSLSALMAAHPKGNEGDTYMVGANLYAWSGTGWIDCGNIQGPKGDKGDTGPQGERGLQGLQGATGATGPQGAKGDKGDAFTYADFTQEQLAALKGPKGDTGSKGDTGERGPQGLQGPKGNDGAVGTAATIKIGTVSTGSAGSAVSVTNSGTTSEVILNFVIPKGDKGDQGQQGEQGLQGIQGPQGIQGATGAAGTAATIKVGAVTTGAAGTAATVTNSGTASAAVLNFQIPRGTPGADGGVTVDEVLNATSLNPVANKTVYAALQEKVTAEEIANTYAKKEDITNITVDAELSDTSTNPVQNKVVKTNMDSLYNNLMAKLNGYRSELPTKVSDLENDAGYLTQHQPLDGYAKTSVANIWTKQQKFHDLMLYRERYTTYVVTGSDTPTTSTMLYTATGAFTLSLGTLAGALSPGQSSVFTAYFTANADYSLTITNAGTIKYIGSASDVAITSAGLLLNIMMMKDARYNLTSIVQASKLS